MQHFAYLLINFLTILFPLLLSFDKKVHFYKRWRHLLPGLLITGTVFLVWDWYFTLKNVWSFNSQYIIGWNIMGLPIEEILFFITVPFSCVFIYECLQAYFPANSWKKVSTPVNVLLMLLSVYMLIQYHDRIYTVVTFSLLMLIVLYVQLSNWQFMGRFYQAFAVSLLPFYDHFYSMALLLMNIVLFEYYKKRDLRSSNERLAGV